MRSIFKFIIVCAIFVGFSIAFAIEDVSLSAKKDYRPTVAILANHLNSSNNTYFIYPESAEMIAQDIANEIIRTGKIKTLLPSENAEILFNSNTRNDANKLLAEYKNTLNVDFLALKKVAKKLNTDTILLVTSDIDYQSNFLRYTFWNVINWPGADVVHPKFIITTNLMLIDPKSEVILMQKIFAHKLPAKDFDLALPRFSPPDGQLSKIKPYSMNLASYVSEDIANRVVNRNNFHELEIPPIFSGNAFIAGKHVNLSELQMKYDKVTNVEQRKQNKAIKEAAKEQKRLIDARVKELNKLNKNKSNSRVKLLKNTKEVDLMPQYVNPNSKNYIYEAL